MAQLARIKKELEMLATDPGPGVSAWTIEDDMTNLGAQIQGPQDSPYAEGTYYLSIQLPERYPFEPPRVRFITPIYHPNIDNDGRICLDTLKMQPQGSWSPSVNINTLLLTIRMLMQTPNADDGLVPEITEEYKRNVALWHKKALEHTRKYAVGQSGHQQQQQQHQQQQQQPSVVEASAHVPHSSTGTATVEPLLPQVQPQPAAPSQSPLKRPLEAVSSDKADGGEDEDENEDEEDDEEDDDHGGFYVTGGAKRSRE